MTLLDTAEVARQLGVPRSTVEKWKHRGLITPAGLVRGRGRGGLVPLYKIEELRPLADAYHQRRARDTNAGDQDG